MRADIAALLRHRLTRQGVTWTVDTHNTRDVYLDYGARTYCIREFDLDVLREDFQCEAFYRRISIALGLSGQAPKPLPLCASPLVRIRLAEAAREKKGVDAQDRARYR